MNKLGLHIIGDNFDATRLGKPRVVKLLDPSLAMKQAVRAQVGPDCLIVIRFYDAGQDLRVPDAAASMWFARNAAKIALMNDPNVAYEGFNEVNSEAYARFERRRLEILHNTGMRAVVGNFSVGTPDIGEWAWYRDMLAAMGPGDVLGTHEYWADSADLCNVWHVGRWRLVPELEGKPIVITECGRDFVEGKGAPGWRKTCSADVFLGDLVRYNALLEQFPNVVGATVYTGGNCYQWEDFCVNDIWDRVTAQYGPPPEPQKPPQEEERMYKLSPFLRYWNRWQVTRPFGYKDPQYTDGWHKGTDLTRNDGGTHGAVIECPFELAVVDVVTWRADRGWYVYLYDESQGCEFFACHLAMEPTCKPGDYLERGEVVGYVGNTGSLTTGAHIHAGLCRVDEELNIQEWVDLFGDQVKITEEV